MPEVSLTRATLRSAEFGFLGVVVYTRVHTPRRCGEPLRAGVETFVVLSCRPLRTSWLMVGNLDPLSVWSMPRRLPRLLGCPALAPRGRVCRTGCSPLHSPSQAASTVSSRSWVGRPARGGRPCALALGTCALVLARHGSPRYRYAVCPPNRPGPGS